VEDSFIVCKKLYLTKSGGSEAGKPWALKSGGLSLGALHKFTPMTFPCIHYLLVNLNFRRSYLACRGL